MNKMGYYWQYNGLRILLLPVDEGMRGYVYRSDEVYQIPSYEVSGVDKRALLSKQHFMGFFNDAWPRVCFNADRDPVAIEVKGRLRGGTWESLAVSGAMFAGGIALSAATGGAAIPILVGSALTGAGASGAIHSISKPDEGFSSDFVEECIIGAATGVVTAGAGLGVKEIAKKAGEHTAKQVLTNIAKTAAKEAAEEVATQAVADLAKIGIKTTVKELSEEMIIQGGKQIIEHSATKVAAGAIGGGLGKVTETTLRNGSLPTAKEAASDFISGGISGGVSAGITVLKEGGKTVEVTTVKQAIAQVGKETVIGSAAGAATATTSKIVTNKLAGKELDEGLSEAAKSGAVIGAASALVTSTAKITKELKSQQSNQSQKDQSVNDERANKAIKEATARKLLQINKTLLDQVQQTADCQDNQFDNTAKANSQIDLYQQYMTRFKCPDDAKQYIDESLDRFSNEQALTEEQKEYVENVREQLHRYFATPSHMEAYSEIFLGHLEDEAGRSALVSGATSDNFRVEGRIKVGANGSCVYNGKQLKTVNLEGNTLPRSANLQTLCMVEAYHQAPPEIKSLLAKEVNVSLLRSQLAMVRRFHCHDYAAECAIKGITNPSSEKISMLIDYYIKEFDAWHALQITFYKKDGLVYPVIDNCSRRGGAEFHPHTKECGQITQVAPVQLEPFDISTQPEEAALRQYVKELSATIGGEWKDVFPVIYESRPQLQNASPLPSSPAQSVGNCSFYCQKSAQQRELADKPDVYQYIEKLSKQFMKSLRNAARMFQINAQNSAECIRTPSTQAGNSLTR